MTYVLQLDPSVRKAWQFHVSWDGYWAGRGYVETPERAIHFRSKREAERVMSGIFVGLNGCMKIVNLRRTPRVTSTEGKSP